MSKDARKLVTKVHDDVEGDLDRDSIKRVKAMSKRRRTNAGNMNVEPDKKMLEILNRKRTSFD